MQVVEVIKQQRHAIVRLNRPEKHNAMNEVMIGELTQQAQDLMHDDTIDCVVLTGAGEKSFCAGGDLNWMRRQFDADRQGRIDEAMALSRMLNAFYNMPKPLIGRINGAAYGGGLGLMAVCDVVLADKRAKFAFTETKLGIVPATISPFVMQKLSPTHAGRYFFSAKLFDAVEARHIGLVNEVSETENLDALVDKEIQAYTLTDMGAVATAKQLMRAFMPPIDEDIQLETAHLLADLWEEPQARQRIGAFLDKQG